ncbi:MAG: hypothetical protein IKU15_00205 [Clostridia bacterium]|nr:hypothetical protein [Clostridia bacterium]
MLIDLIKEFNEYTETAEQHEFLKLATIHMMIERTNLKEVIKDERNAGSMYRVIASAIGKDARN